MKYLLIVSFLFLISYVQSQVGIVRGKVVSASSNVGLPLVKIQLLDQQIGAISSEDGSYEIKGIAPGVYSFKASSPGFKDQIIKKHNPLPRAARCRAKAEMGDRQRYAIVRFCQAVGGYSLRI